mgnify:CR=1 FL=1
MDELKHFGVKGMKWGVRKERKSVKSMTDKELQKANNRMRLEREYKELKHPNISRAKNVYRKAVIGGLSGAAGALTIKAIKQYGAKKYAAAVLAVTIRRNL